MDKGAKVFIVGHHDVTDRSLVKHFRGQGFGQVISSAERKVDLLDPSAVRAFFKNEKPLYVILTSVRSGGIGANQTYAGEFIYENLQAQTNVIHAAYQQPVQKLLFVGASCVYPKDCPLPIKEEFFLGGPMERTSEPYSLAKAAGIVMCQAYRKQYGFEAISIVPATVYGPDEGAVEAENAHVVGALMAKFRKAVKDGAGAVELWGTGEPRREFLYADDFASACHFLLENYTGGELLNVGTGVDVSIRELAMIVREVSGFKGEINWDTSRPDGTKRKFLDSSRLFSMGWKPKVGLAEGIQKAYQTYEQGVGS
jgi:GDP-L-fucose synthase